MSMYKQIIHSEFTYNFKGIFMYKPALKAMGAK